MIKLLITDLDDTLYSWIGFFVPAFYDMLNALSVILEKKEADLLLEYRKIHQEKGSVEFPHATLLLPSVIQKFPDYTKSELMEALDVAFYKFNSARKKNLHLFPTVKETLECLSKSGIIIVGYTDSAEENGFYRLKKLGIEELFHKVYVSDSQYERPDHIPASPKTQIVQGKKPNPGLLEQICISEGIHVSEVLYVGDSITKDIYMAKVAGILSVLCNFPKREDAGTLYKKLVAISHWTASDFQIEDELKDICRNHCITPDFIIESYSGIIQIVEKLNIKS